MFDKKFWIASAERAIKTFVQALLATFGSAQLGILDLPWESAISLAATAALLSVLTSVASANFGPSKGPSLVGETTEEVKKPASKSKK